jgi:hypothetical protein
MFAGFAERPHRLQQSNRFNFRASYTDWIQFDVRSGSRLCANAPFVRRAKTRLVCRSFLAESWLHVTRLHANQRKSLGNGRATWTIAFARTALAMQHPF